MVCQMLKLKEEFNWLTPYFALFLILLLATMAERTKRSKAWLHFNKAKFKDEVTCLKIYFCKGRGILLQ